MAKKNQTLDEDDDSMTGRIKSDFPKHTLESSIRVSRAIEDANGGRPYPPTDIAIAIGVSPGSSDFRAVLSSAHKYGVSEGSYKSERIALTPLGARIVAPTGSEDAKAALIEATLRPETFRRIFDHFVGKKLPDEVFFQNTVVREFGIPKEHAAKCVQLFTTNVTAVGLTRQAPTGVWLSASANGANATTSPPSEDPNAGSTQDDPPPPPAAVQEGRRGEIKKSIFIGHGKNKKPLQQLEKILSHYGIPFKVATEEANQFRPISEKVAAVMHECGAAILIFTADEEFRSPDGQVVWRPSENVVHELGAASVLYGGRIIVFKEKTLNLPSNFSGIGYISFEQDRLDGEANSLFKELVAFGLVKITVG